MSPILERAIAPIIVTVIWVMAILMLAREHSGAAPMIAGLIGGVALVLLACLGGEREIKRVFGLRAHVAGALALLALLGGAALAVTLSDADAARVLVQIASEPITLGFIASLLLRLGIALSLAAIIAEASLRLIEEARS
jgi:hypothetical protein